MTEIHTVTDFNGLGIAEKLLESIRVAGLINPTPIQREAIPAAIKGQDLVGIAQTGTGKTLAFSVPMLQRLALYKGRGLVLVPTRELAIQVDDNIRKYGASMGIRTAVLIGGENINRQMNALRRGPHIIIATPGRLNDHLDRHSVKLDDVKVLVLDEADLMLDMGFLPQIDAVLKFVPKERQTLLFSATMPPGIVSLLKKYMTEPVRVEVAPSGTTAEGVDQEIFIVNRFAKLAQLEKLLQEYSGSVLIFCRTKHGAKDLTKKVELMGHAVAEIHSNRSQQQRRAALDGFRSGRIRILVATDIAARGIDVKNIALVVNYDLPDEINDYVHRIGRTARAGKTGKAISFADPAQAREIREIERLVKKVLPKNEISKLESRPSHGSDEFKRRGPNRTFNKPARFEARKPFGDSARRQDTFSRKDKPTFQKKSYRGDYSPRKEAFARGKANGFSSEFKNVARETDAFERYTKNPTGLAPISNDRRPSYADRRSAPARPWTNDGPKRFERGDRREKPFGDKRERPFADRRSAPAGRWSKESPKRFGDRAPRRPYGDRPVQADGEAKPYSGYNKFKTAPGRSYGSRQAKPFAGRSKFKPGGKPSFGGFAKRKTRPPFAKKSSSYSR